MQVGVENFVALPNDATPVAVRLMVQRRTVGQAEWEAMWTADVVSRSEEVVRWTADSDPGSSVVVWVYPLPDGMILVVTELNLGESQTVQATSSHLQLDGVPVKVLSAHVDGCEYRVYQTVALLRQELS